MSVILSTGDIRKEYEIVDIVFVCNSHNTITDSSMHYKKLLVVLEIN